MFDGSVEYWKGVKTVKFVFETGGWIEFEANLKEKFDRANTSLP